jgi:hypothetical protein
MEKNIVNTVNIVNNVYIVFFLSKIEPRFSLRFFVIKESKNLKL